MANNVLRTIQQHARKAGITLTAPLTVHTFRESFGQHHADNGTPIHVLQRLMGHSNITTTREFYIRVADANEEAAVKVYEQLLVGQAASPPEGKTSDARVTPAPAEAQS
jgi:integrase